MRSKVEQHSEKEEKGMRDVRRTTRGPLSEGKVFFATLECELLDRCRFRPQAEARMAVFEFIKGRYIPHRCHSALDYLSPINYQRSHQVQGFTASPSPSTETG